MAGFLSEFEPGQVFFFCHKFHFRLYLHDGRRHNDASPLVGGLYSVALDELFESRRCDI